MRSSTTRSSPSFWIKGRSKRKSFIAWCDSDRHPPHPPLEDLIAGASEETLTPPVNGRQSTVLVGCEGPSAPFGRLGDCPRELREECLYVPDMLLASARPAAIITWTSRTGSP
jgi:hypothetical protein